MTKKTKLSNQHHAIEAIKKKLVGKRLTYSEIFTLMDEIANKRLGEVLTTYFAAATFTEGFNKQELYYLTLKTFSTISLLVYFQKKERTSS